MNAFAKYKLAKESDELKNLILEHPDLPLVVLVADDACFGDFSWTFCGSISFQIDEILDCDYVDSDDTVFTDRTRLEEKIADDLYDDYCDKPQEDYEAAIKRKLEELEPYWTKVIAIYAGN